MLEKIAKCKIYTENFIGLALDANLSSASNVASKYRRNWQHLQIRHKQDYNSIGPK